MASRIQDVVVLKAGAGSINGNVRTSQYTLKMPYGMLKLKKRDILSIEYNNPPYLKTDEVQVSAGTRLSGNLLPANISVSVEDTGEVLVIPKTDIVAIIFFTGRTGPLSTKTRRALKRLP